MNQQFNLIQYHVRLAAPIGERQTFDFESSNWANLNDTALKNAIEEYQELPKGTLSTYEVDRAEGTVTVRPQAIYG